jgi:hypothetical protein
MECPVVVEDAAPGAHRSRRPGTDEVGPGRRRRPRRGRITSSLPATAVGTGRAESKEPGVCRVREQRRVGESIEKKKTTVFLLTDDIYG